MKKPCAIGQAVKVCGLIVLFWMGSGFARLHTQQVTFQIMPSSRLFIEGTSNVSRFQCYCQDSFDAQTIWMEQVSGSYTSHFAQSELALATKSLDCGNQIMNKDLYNALKADDFPQIKLELRQVTRKHEVNNEWDWYPLEAKALLTIAGVTNVITLDALSKKVDENSYRLRSVYPLRMTQFGVTPPTAMLGMIKVNDQISIHFDLLVEVKPED